MPEINACITNSNNVGYSTSTFRYFISPNDSIESFPTNSFYSISLTALGVNVLQRGRQEEGRLPAGETLREGRRGPDPAA